MSTNGGDPRKGVNLIRDTGVEFTKGVWAEEYPAEYNRAAVMREVDERIKEYVYNPAGDGSFLDASIPRSKIRDNIQPVIIHEVIRHAGALPQSGIFNKVFDDSHCWFHHTGSAYTTTVAGVIGYNVTVDGLNLGTGQIFANVINQHMFLNPWAMTFPSATFGSVDLHKGPHTCSFTVAGGLTVTDSNDIFVLVVFEFPR